MVVCVPTPDPSASLIWRLAQKWLKQSGWSAEDTEQKRSIERNMREKKSLEEKYGRMEGEYTEYLKSRLPKFDTVLLQG